MASIPYKSSQQIDRQVGRFEKTVAGFGPAGEAEFVAAAASDFADMYDGMNAGDETKARAALGNLGTMVVNMEGRHVLDKAVGTYAGAEAATDSIATVNTAIDTAYSAASLKVDKSAYQAAIHQRYSLSMATSWANSTETLAEFVNDKTNSSAGGYDANFAGSPIEKMVIQEANSIITTRFDSIKSQVENDAITVDDVKKITENPATNPALRDKLVAEYGENNLDKLTSKFDTQLNSNVKVVGSFGGRNSGSSTKFNYKDGQIEHVNKEIDYFMNETKDSNVSEEDLRTQLQGHYVQGLVQHWLDSGDSLPDYIASRRAGSRIDPDFAGSDIETEFLAQAEAIVVAEADKLFEDYDKGAITKNELHAILSGSSAVTLPQPVVDKFSEVHPELSFDTKQGEGDLLTELANATDPVTGSIDHHKLAQSLRNYGAGLTKNPLSHEAKEAMDDELKRFKVRGNIRNRTMNAERRVASREYQNAQRDLTNAEWATRFELIKKVAPVLLIPVALGIGGTVGGIALGMNSSAMMAALGGVGGLAAGVGVGTVVGAPIAYGISRVIQSDRPWLGWAGKSYREKQNAYDKLLIARDKKEEGIIDMNERVKDSRDDIKVAAAKTMAVFIAKDLGIPNPKEIADSLVKTLGIDDVRAFRASLNQVTKLSASLA